MRSRMCVLRDSEGNCEIRLHNNGGTFNFLFVTRAFVKIPTWILWYPVSWCLYQSPSLRPLHPGILLLLSYHVSAQWPFCSEWDGLLVGCAHRLFLGRTLWGETRGTRLLSKLQRLVNNWDMEQGLTCN